LYTGSIGYLEHAPNTPLGFSGCLNVVIRTLQLRPHDQAACTFDGIYGVGSGIVADSQAVSEYAECGWKARFISELRPE
ncbi:chorismate-binding protein, partial [Kingella kingae]